MIYVMLFIVLAILISGFVSVASQVEKLHDEIMLKLYDFLGEEDNG